MSRPLRFTVVVLALAFLVVVFVVAWNEIADSEMVVTRSFWGHMVFAIGATLTAAAIVWAAVAALVAAIQWAINGGGKR